MNGKRRQLLKNGGGMAVLAAAIAAGLVRPRDAFAADWNKDAFTTTSFNDVVKAMGGSGVTQSNDIQITAPDIAENGAVVPISVTSNLPGTQSIGILVEKNPSILSAEFDIPEGTDPYVQTRVKMGQSSNVIVLVKAGGKYYSATKEVKVTLGGCGG
jgi:sulfur-oxidizing protein SoxY